MPRLMMFVIDDVSGEHDCRLVVNAQALPKWVGYVAVDEDGWVWMFESRPFADDDEDGGSWSSNHGRVELWGAVEALTAAQFPLVVRNWADLCMEVLL